MRKEDAELKANALSKDLAGKEAEHKGSKRKCVITSVETVADGEAGNFEVFCFFTPLDAKLSTKKMGEEIGYFLSTYRILSILSIAG